MFLCVCVGGNRRRELHKLTRMLGRATAATVWESACWDSHVHVLGRPVWTKPIGRVSGMNDLHLLVLFVACLYACALGVATSMCWAFLRGSSLHDGCHKLTRRLLAMVFLSSHAIRRISIQSRACCCCSQWLRSSVASEYGFFFFVC